MRVRYFSCTLAFVAAYSSCGDALVLLPHQTATAGHSGDAGIAIAF